MTDVFLFLLFNTCDLRILSDADDGGPVPLYQIPSPFGRCCCGPQACIRYARMHFLRNKSPSPPPWYTPSVIGISPMNAPTHATTNSVKYTRHRFSPLQIVRDAPPHKSIGLADKVPFFSVGGPPAGQRLLLIDLLSPEDGYVRFLSLQSLDCNGVFFLHIEALGSILFKKFPPHLGTSNLPVNA